MAVIVQKYGGSSVSDIDKLRVVADRVAAARRSGDAVVVVVSAMGKATDNLLALARQAAQAAATAHNRASNVRAQDRSDIGRYLNRNRSRGQNSLPVRFGNSVWV